MNHPTADLGKFVSTIQFENLPEEVVDHVKMAFADCVGAIIAATHEPAPRILESMLASASTEATVIGGKRASALDAAWINGTAAHALDYDDVAQRGGHPSAYLVPAILADAEVLGSTGKEMIAAYAAGYEVFADLIWRDADEHHEKGWHPTGLFGPIGAAAACASLRKLDPHSATMAIALSASRSSGLVSNFGTMAKPFHAGSGAHSGVACARIAGLGFTASIDAFEHTPGLLAAISLAGRVDAGLSELTDAFVLRENVQHLMSCVSVQTDLRPDPKRPGFAIHDRIEVRMHDGNVFDSGPISHVRGDPDHPLTGQELWTKFEDCVREGDSSFAARPLFESLMALEQQPNVQEIVALLAPIARNVRHRRAALLAV